MPQLVAGPDEAPKVTQPIATKATGAGKHIQPQLSFARDNGIEIFFGNPADQVPGKNIILPEHPSMIKAVDLDVDKLRKSLIKQAVASKPVSIISEMDLLYLMQETKTNIEFVKKALDELGVNY